MNIPLVPLRDVVIFPGVVTPLFVGRESSINSLQKAMSDDKSVMLVAQREANTENPSQKDLYEIGTVSTILQLIKLPDGTYKVLVEGIKRARLQNLLAGKDILEEADSENISSAVSVILDFFEEKKIDCPVLYGGSVSKSNIEEIISIPGIDGCLVGNSSLDGEQFAIIASKIRS